VHEVTQLPLSQVCEELQLLQAAPLVPQAVLVVPARHWSPSQQPSGHEVALQVHLPETHACDEAQARQAPPPVPQKAVVFPATQLPPASQQPEAQVLLLQVCGMS